MNMAEVHDGLPSADGYVVAPDMDTQTEAAVFAAVEYARANTAAFAGSPMRGQDGAVVFDQTGTLAIKRFFPPEEREVRPTHTLMHPATQFRALNVLNGRMGELKHPHVNISLPHAYYADSQLVIMERIPRNAPLAADLARSLNYRLGDGGLVAKAFGWFLLRLEEHSKYKMRKGEEFAAQLGALDPDFQSTFNPEGYETIGFVEPFIRGQYGSDPGFFFDSLLGFALSQRDSGSLFSYERQVSLREHVHLRKHVQPGESLSAPSKNWDVIITDPVASSF